MTMNPLPPQAYTKDTLTKAYLWLLNQNESIKELATTPDTLVTLYLKAQRNGDDSLDTPSIQNFKNELKSLAGLMGELDGKPSAEKFAPPASQNQPTSQTQSPSQSPTASHASAGPSTSPFLGATSMNFQSAPPSPFPNSTASSTPNSSSHHSGQGAPSSSASSTRRPAPTANSSLPPEIIGQLDLKSQAMVAEVREELNLGSDVEVLRLLISLGYKKARNLYS